MEQPRPPLTFADRFGRLTTHAPLVAAAIVAAHGAASETGSFRASDVRFFYLLFSNWIERDVVQPGQDLDLTQVRRSLARLVADGGAAIVWARGRSGPRARGVRWTLTSRGLSGLVDTLVDPRPRRPFDEALFVICFAALYRDAVAARVGADDPAVRRRVRDRLDPMRVLRSARRTVDELRADLEHRAAEGAVLEREATSARREGVSRKEAARRLERTSTYQLHRVRPLSEVLDSLPDDLARIELGDAIAWRNRALFEPMIAVVKAQHAALHALEARLGAK